MGEIKFFNGEGGVIGYEDTGGTGIPIFLVPGMGDLMDVYRFIIPDLINKGYRVISMDLRGIGSSSVKWKDYSENSIASDIYNLNQHLKLKDTILVGNSISAGSACIVTSMHNELISKLILISPFARNVSIPLIKKILFRLALSWPWGSYAWSKYYSTHLYPFRKPEDMDQYEKKIRSILQEKGRLRAFQKMAATDHSKSEESLNNIVSPVLVVMGNSDPDFPDPSGEAKWLADKIGGRYEMIEGAGHYPQAEFPEKFLSIMSHFLGE